MGGTVGVAFCLFAWIHFVYSKHEMYDGHAVYKLKIEKAGEMEFINSLTDSLRIDVWMYAAPGGDAVVMVPKENIQQFRRELSLKGIESEVEVENIKESLDEEDRLMAHARAARSGAPRVGFDRIYNLTEVNTYLEELAAEYSDRVTLVNAGKSVEGRDIKYLKISTTNFEDTSKPIVFVQSLLHAREWVTLPATLYTIDQLLVNVTDPTLVDSIDWIILPIANPDGFDFTFTANRFWRKNRARGFLPGDICSGVDLNRNFDAYWGDYSSNNVCSEIFHGRHAFSEPETRIIRDILHEYRGRIELFIDVHSFGSLILYGWGSGNLPSNALIVHLVGIRMAEAIDAEKTHWTPNYRVGNAALILYRGSGLAMDYAKIASVPLSYVYELPAFRHAAGTLLGFLVDPAYVEQFGRETWEGIKTGAIYVRDNL